MMERGVTQNMVEIWARTGKSLQQVGDKILYVTRQGAVVIDKAGKVITAYLLLAETDFWVYNTYKKHFLNSTKERSNLYVMSETISLAKMD